MEITTRPLTRQQLSEFLPNHRAIVAFETVQKDISTQGDVFTTAPFVTTDENTNLAAARVLTGNEDVTVTDDPVDHRVTLGLADTGVIPNTYGQPTRILVLAIDAKGRITDAQEIKFDVSDVDGLLAVPNGGTGLDAYTVGDLIVADGTESLASLPDVAVGMVLKSGGVGVAPEYGQVDMTTDVTGVLPEANGGFPAGGFTGGPALYTSLTFVNGLCTAAS